jgi:hypothetical protein
MWPIASVGLTYPLLACGIMQLLCSAATAAAVTG